MDEIRFKVKKNVNEKLLEKQFASLGLHQTMKGSLKSLPDNIHWHLKRKGEPGVCEITCMPKTDEIIISCKKNRQGDWIEEIAHKLRDILAA